MWTDRARVLQDVTPGDWLAPRLTGPPGTVTGTVPAGYAAYARVLHPVDRGSEEPGMSWADVARVTGRRVHPLVQWHALIGADDPWTHSSDLWDEGEPPEGNLPLPALVPLVGLLATHTTTPQECCFAMWEGWGSHNGNGARIVLSSDADAATGWEPLPPLYDPREWAAPRLALPHRDHLLLAGPLDAAADIARYEPGSRWTQSPALFWPADRAWCVATEIDFDSTVVGGTAAAIAAVLASPDLEALPVEPGDSLRSDADLVNR